MDDAGHAVCNYCKDLNAAETYVAASF
jgi:hypothetical protein